MNYSYSTLMHETSTFSLCLKHSCKNIYKFSKKKNCFYMITKSENFIFYLGQLFDLNDAFSF